VSSSIRPQELNDLYESLSSEERDKLLRILLYAASISGDMVIQRLEERLPQLAGRELTGESPEQ
jgi:hypothetical protein